MLFSLAAYLHRLDPFAFRVSGDFGIRWYGLSYLAGFLAGFWIIRGLARRGKSTLDPLHVSDFVVTVALGTVIGGRLGYCVFYKPELLVGFSGEFPFWDVLAINKGGMASHGGILGILAAILWYARRHRQPALHLMDLAALTAPVGVFFGRVANFVNGELLGRPASPQLPWAVKFPQELHDWLAPTHPKHGLLSSPEYLKIAAEAAAKTGREASVDTVIAATQKHEGIARMLEPLLTPRHPSQLYEALLEGALVFVVLLAIWARPRKPGVIAGWFLVLYAAVRIVGEQFRLPDAHIADQEFAVMGVTRGQLLSAVMLLIGVVCLVIWSRRDAAKLGGWADRSAA